MKTSKLMTGTLESDYGVTFPMTWRPESKAWAIRRRLTQADVDAIEARLVIFRYKRDVYAMRLEAA